MSQVESPYTPKFFRGNARSAMRSARPVLQILFDLYSPHSIVDIGCGSGGWLAEAERLGADVVRGYDGPWADPRVYSSPTIDFVPVDLEKSGFEHDRRYDLAMSVEVAEHLSESRADFVVDALCAASDVVLFGAAIPYQGGVHHIHEVPQKFWIEKFRDRGYEPFDIIRPVVWDNTEVQYWFRQNTLVYVKEGSDALDRAKLRAMEHPIWDVVHPLNLERKALAMRKAQKQARRISGLEQQLARQGDQLHGSKTRAAELKRRLATSDKLAADLQRQLTEPWWRRRLRTSVANLPAPLRPAAIRIWHALPEPVRRKVRGHSSIRTIR